MMLFKPTQSRIAFAGLLFLILPAHKPPGGNWVAVPTRAMVSLYTPVESEILADYERDQSNKKLQTWAEYWSWVQTFYKGHFLSEGWNKFSQVTLEAVKVEDKRPAVVERLNQLGKTISREWAKHSSVSRITTTDLRRWNDAVIEARRVDDGSGKRIMAALRDILAQAESRR